MIEACPSPTAWRVARRRAAHQLLDDPKILVDPVAVPLLGQDGSEDRRWLDDSGFSQVLRASLAVRSRYAEDCLHAAVAAGVGQYVVLGAGLDTFALRNPYPTGALRVFEVDRPDTQAWKRRQLTLVGLTPPPSLIFVPVDLETRALGEALRAAGLAMDRPTFCSWLGVSMYLTAEAITATLTTIAALAPGSAIVFDYLIAPVRLQPGERQALDRLMQHVARAGEPFRTFFDPPALHAQLRAMGFGEIEDLGPEEKQARYFQGRTDGLRAGRLARVLQARIPTR